MKTIAQPLNYQIQLHQKDEVRATNAKKKRKCNGNCNCRCKFKNMNENYEE